MITNFSIFHDFFIIFSLITQRVLIGVRWKGILLSKIQKIRNPTTTMFLNLFLFLSWFETELLKVTKNC
jgi:hypothetical protein